MNDLLRTATPELARFLNASLPNLAPDWWPKHVVARLSFQQQRIVTERGHRTLMQLDFAALLRVLDQNWHELSAALNLPHEGRTWVKELQTVRNKWAHLSTETMPPSEVYRDADTLSRLLDMIGADQISRAAVDSAKGAALAAMAGQRTGEASSQPLGGGTSDAHPGGTATISPLSSQSPASLFCAGDLVALRSNPEIILPVIEVIPGGGECRYRVFQNNLKATYYESQLQSPPGRDKPPLLLSAQELQARLTSLHILSPSTTRLFSLRSGRVQFVPYQYRPVLKLIRADRPRLLIADEVGVGKTIEAGLIIKELRARMDLSSVLIICPKALVAERKWALEMKRFDESFTPLDGRLLRHCLKESHLDGEWPEQYAKAILPFSLFDSDLVFGTTGAGPRRNQGLFTLDPPPKFDLVIVDEAHHIRNSDTFLHQGVRYFCDNANAVLFLTATPVQLGSQDLYTLLNALRPDLIFDLASFEQMAAPNRHINSTLHHIRAARDGWQREACSSLNLVASTEWGRLFLRESPAFQEICDRLNESPISDADRIGLIRSTEELYTFSSLISRTRRRDIGEFTTRKPETLAIDFTPAQKELHDSLLDVVARILARFHGQQNVKFMMTTIRRQAASCLYGLAPLLRDILAGKLSALELMEASDGEEDSDFGFLAQVKGDVAALVEAASDLEPHDPKVEAFVGVLADKGKLPNNKSLVFSTFRHTLAYLAQHTGRTGLRYGLIHGDVPDEERATLRRRFALPKEDGDALDVLLSSEVGCEGLDLQFCNCLINYDLPWNPMRIEQRIGRLDRYGQKSETIAIVNIITPGTVDAEIYERCLWRIGVFQQCIGGNEEILGEITQKLHDIEESFGLTPKEREQQLRQLADNGIRRIREEQDLESKQAELFGLNIPSQSWRQEIEAAECHWLSPAAIELCVNSYLSARLGVDGEHLLGEQARKTLRLSQDARCRLLADYKSLPRSAESIPREWEKWLKGGQPTLSVTFDQSTAAATPSTTYLSVMHPLVRQAAASFQLTEPALVTLSATSADLPTGTYHFALYRWKRLGVRADEAIVPVASNPAIESSLLVLLQSAQESIAAPLPQQAAFDSLDSRHHEKWTSARANHTADNRLQVEYRIQSLTASHRARCKVIEDHVARASNERIAVMKKAELSRANLDFSQRLEALGKESNGGDIHAAAVLFGTIAISGGRET